jgi:tetratricopeptide (TPR) repeat protein
MTRGAMPFVSISQYRRWYFIDSPLVSRLPVIRSPGREMTMDVDLPKLLLVAIVCVCACKPEHEEARSNVDAFESTGLDHRHDVGAPTAGQPDSPGNVPPQSSPLLRLTAPDPITWRPRRSKDLFTSPQPPGSGLTARIPESAQPVATAHEQGLSKIVLAVLAEGVTEQAELQAKRITRKGIALERQGQHVKAIAAYDEALALWAAHAPANYALAAAMARVGKLDRALFHLRILAALDKNSARKKLQEARVHPDFSSLHTDKEFQAVTHYIPIRIVPSTNAVDSKILTRLEKRLTRAGLPVSTGAPWAEPLTQTTLLMRPGNPWAEEVADEIDSALNIVLPRSSRIDLAPDQPLVIVVHANDPSNHSVGHNAVTVQSFFGLKLATNLQEENETLVLKKTGFFIWERLSDADVRVTRSGRYFLEDNTLSLDYRQVTERPRQGGGPPSVRIDQGRRTSHRIDVEDGNLLLDGQRFAP